MATVIDSDDSFCIVFKVGDKEYRCDSLVFSSIVMDKTPGDEEPSKQIIVDAMKEALDSHEGLSEHQLFAMSVRMTKAIARSGNA